MIQKWTWVNEPKPDRLRVEQLKPGVVQYMDTRYNEFVRVKTNADPEKMVFEVGEGTPPEVHTTRMLKDAQHVVVGSGLAERDVYHVITADHAVTLRIGLTIHKSAFSSTPHTFELDPEPGFEEVFYFLLPAGGKGLIEAQGLWPKGINVDRAWPVRHRQLAQVPMGSHRVAALPDNEFNIPQLMYVWGYLALFDRWEKLK